MATLLTNCEMPRWGIYKMPIHEGGDVLAILINASQIDQLRMARYDGSWSYYNSTSHGFGTLDNINCISAVSDGTTIHVAILIEASPNGRLLYIPYTISTDTWGSWDDIYGAELDTENIGTAMTCDIAIRSDGDIIIMHTGTAYTDKGVDYQRVSYTINEGSGFGSEISIDDGGVVRYTMGGCTIGANDVCHFAYLRRNPPATASHKSLTSTNSLSSATTLNDNVPETLFHTNPKYPVYYDVSGVERMTFGWIADTDYIASAEMEDEGVPSAEELVSDYKIVYNIHYCFTVDQTNKVVHCIYADTGTGGVFDVHYDKNIDSGGWGTDVTIFSGTYEKPCATYLSNKLHIIVEDVSVSEPGDVLYETYSVAVGVDYFRSVADTVGITDTIAAVVGKIASIADSIGVTDALTVVLDKVITLTDAVDIADSISKIGTFKKFIADNIGITDVITKSVGRIVALADNIGITDVITAIKGGAAYFANLADNIGITDVITKSVGRIVALADNVGITDVISKIGTFKRDIQDAVGITDVLSIVGIYIRDIADNIGITDVITKSIGRIVALADAVGITDIINAVVFKLVSISDSVGITDDISKTGQFVRVLASVVGITDSISKVGQFLRGIADAIGITDLLVTSGVIPEAPCVLALTSEIAITFEGESFVITALNENAFVQDMSIDGASDISIALNLDSEICDMD